MKASEFWGSSHEVLKKAQYVPINLCLKYQGKRDKHLVIGPMAVVPTFGIVLEWIMQSQLNDYFVSYNLPSSSQYF